MSDKTAFDVTLIDWNKSGGLVPAIVQDTDSLRVLMLGYMNLESLKRTLTNRRVTFFSRSKQRLWEKGETSGNALLLHDLKLDCDGDTLLIKAKPLGPTCHTGTTTCFGEASDDTLSVLADLAQTINQRKINPAPNSYTCSLFAQGMARMAQKVGEEGVEVALAATTDPSKLAEESADLLYHLLVLLEANGLGLKNVLAVLRQRANAE